MPKKILALATLTIVASTDEEVDEVYRVLHPLMREWPNTPIINITETSRELKEMTP